MDSAVVCQNVVEKWRVDSNYSYHNLEFRWFLYTSMNKEGFKHTDTSKWEMWIIILKCLFKNNEGISPQCINYYFNNEK